MKFANQERGKLLRAPDNPWLLSHHLSYKLCFIGYEQLYRSGGIDHIDLRNYLHNLVEGLSKSYLSKPEIVMTETQIDDIQLDIKRAMPLGIILNELVINALKYAFPASYIPNNGQKVICVELSASSGRISLCVTDNGIGFPIEKEHRASTSLGLVEILTRQLHGDFVIDGHGGCTAQVSFDLE